MPRRLLAERKGLDKKAVADHKNLNSAEDLDTKVFNDAGNEMEFDNHMDFGGEMLLHCAMDSDSKADLNGNMDLQDAKVLGCEMPYGEKILSEKGSKDANAQKAFGDLKDLDGEVILDISKALNMILMIMARKISKDADHGALSARLLMLAEKREGGRMRSGVKGMESVGRSDKGGLAALNIFDSFILHAVADCFKEVQYLEEKKEKASHRLLAKLDFEAEMDKESLAAAEEMASENSKLGRIDAAQLACEHAEEEGINGLRQMDDSIKKEASILGGYAKLGCCGAGSEIIAFWKSELGADSVKDMI